MEGTPSIAHGDSSSQCSFDHEKTGKHFMNKAEAISKDIHIYTVNMCLYVWGQEECAVLKVIIVRLAKKMSVRTF